MVAYPLLGMAFGHGYPRAPMFGIREDVGLLLAGLVTAVTVLRAKPATDEATTVEASPQTAS